MQLTEQDYKILMEALDAWVEHADDNRIMAHLAYAAVTHRGDPEAGKAEFDENTKSFAGLRQQREEDALLLKAKLVQLKREQRMNDLFKPDSE